MKKRSDLPIVLFMIVLLLRMPAVVCAEQKSVAVQSTKKTAQTDASLDVNRPVWLVTGCLLSGLVFVPGRYSVLLPPGGLIGIYFHQTGPPPTRLMGKSPEYVAVYTSAYKSKKGRLQVQWTLGGCVTGGVIVGAFYAGFVRGLMAFTQA